MIRVLREALADQRVDAVVRPIQSDLSPVSGLSRDLALQAGEKVEEMLSRLGSLPLGGAVMTPAGDLECDFLIHVVVTSPDEEQTSASVQKALQNGLRRAADMGVESLALPPLGIGVGLTEPEVSARSLVETLMNHVDEGVPPSDLTIVVSSSYEFDLFSQFVAELQRDRDTE
jgi:O-acetyl-ADP-ribose deacetylase (regulator of RNase III)